MRLSSLVRSLFGRVPSSPPPENLEMERICGQAEQIAFRYHSEFIGTEHVLLALLETEASPATLMLERCGARIARIREALIRLIETGAESAVMEEGSLPRTPRLKTVLELARAEIAEAGRGLSTPVALLLGFLREPDSAAAQILSAEGVTDQAVRAAVSHDHRAT